MRLRGAPSSHKFVPEKKFAVHRPPMILGGSTANPPCPSPSRIIPDTCSLPPRGNSPEKRGRRGVPGKLWRESGDFFDQIALTAPVHDHLANLRATLSGGSGIGLEYARYSITSSVRVTDESH